MLCTFLSRHKVATGSARRPYIDTGWCSFHPGDTKGLEARDVVIIQCFAS